MGPMVEDDEPAVTTHPASHEGYDIGRLLAFSDGVFAIAITLLVLSIPVPNVPHGADEGSRLAAALGLLAPNLVGFCLSFVLVGTHWISHHRMLRQLTFCDARLLWLNLLLLLGICLVPFATTLLVHYGDSAVGAISYGTLQAGIGVTYLALRLYLAARGALAHKSLLVSAVPIAGFVVAMPVALRSVDAAYALWVAAFTISRTIEARTHSAA
jgi:uncharacterized membrane protein